MAIAHSTLGDRASSHSHAFHMLNVFAHELRGPLSPIRTAASCLALQIPPGTPPRKPVEIIQRQLRTLESLIDSVLEAARLQQETVPPVLRRIDLRFVVATAVEAVGPTLQERGHGVVSMGPSRPVFVDADAGQVGQIVRNLLTNAAKYTDRGGSIDIRTSVGGGFARVTVRDNGIGLTPDELETIFELYAQAGQAGSARSAGGLGIGLYVARQLAIAHGGNVVAKSDGPQLGSEFTLSLPAARK